MLALPRTAMLSRGRLRAFWLSLWLLSGIGISVIAPTKDARRSALIGASVFTAGVLPGLAKPGLVRWPYRVWDHGARRFANVAITYTTWIAHTTATTPMDPSTLDATPREPLQRTSRWSHRGTQPSSTYTSPSLDPAHARAQDRPVRMAYKWARDSARPRGRWLVACLAVLRWLQSPNEANDRASVPSDTYTLY